MHTYPVGLRGHALGRRQLLLALALAVSAEPEAATAPPVPRPADRRRRDGQAGPVVLAGEVGHPDAAPPGLWLLQRSPPGAGAQAQTQTASAPRPAVFLQGVDVPVDLGHVVPGVRPRERRPDVAGAGPRRRLRSARRRPGHGRLGRRLRRRRGQVHLARSRGRRLGRWSVKLLLLLLLFLVRKHANRPRPAGFPGEYRLWLLLEVRRRLLWHLVPHIPGRGRIPLGRHKRGEVGRHFVVRLREVHGLGLGVGRRRVSGVSVSVLAPLPT